MNFHLPSDSPGGGGSLLIAIAVQSGHLLFCGHHRWLSAAMHDYAGQVLTSVLLWAGRTVLQEKCCKAPPKTLPDHTVVILNGTALCGKSTIALSLLKTTPGAKLLSEHHQYIGDSTVPAQRASTAEARQVVAQHARSFSTKGFPVVIDHSDPNHIVALQLAAAHVPEQGGRVLSVLVHAPLQELPARAHAVRSHRQGVDLPPSKAGWHPHGACPASSVWLPYVQYGAFYKGVPQGSPGGLEVLSRSSVSGVLDSAAAQALREGRRAADVAWEQGTPPPPSLPARPVPLADAHVGSRTRPLRCPCMGHSLLAGWGFGGDVVTNE